MTTWFVPFAVQLCLSIHVSKEIVEEYKLSNAFQSSLIAADRNVAKSSKCWHWKLTPKSQKHENPREEGKVGRLRFLCSSVLVLVQLGILCGVLSQARAQVEIPSQL